ncbi:MAG: DUF2892 domain-containing protein [Nanoarchaeota archaeon]|nr:DUF2892 domain-containing protein [Nanoarchaeota archaeon]
MKVEKMVLAFAGIFILASSLLGYFCSKYWLFFTMFVGLNLFQYSFTGFCPLKIILKKIGVRE